jgi:hypothetical protein
MIEIVKVVQVEPIGGYRVRVRFSNGSEGVRDFADVVAEGGAMVAPLVDPAFFSRVFVQNGVPAWPNGFDVDAIALHREMHEAGLLTPAAADAM